MKKGIVYLVGGGPGDAGLITLKAVECIKTADVIIYDYLVNKKFLEYVKHNAKIIYAGKSGSFHVMSQAEINKLIVREAKKGQIVVRLKGGDPIIFGRGAEELEFLEKNKIKFEVMPGVTSAIAGPIYAGIPLTHRDFASSVAFVTGHEGEGKNESSINWKNLVNGVGTVVILMGMSNLKQITGNFIKHGKSKNTPVAIIQNATTTKQRVIIGNLSNIYQKVVKAKISAPALIVVGKVVSLREKLKWFDTKPLFGKTVVVTRSIKQAGSFSVMLEKEGAYVIEFPTIKIVASKLGKREKSLIKNIGLYDIIIFTSVNGVEIFMDILRNIGNIEVLKRKKIYAIGPVTAKTIEYYGFKVEDVPSEFRAEAILSVLGDIRNKKILLPRAEEGREILVELLEKKGAIVDEISIYKTESEKNVPKEFISALKSGSIDYITFTSSSTVKNFNKLSRARFGSLKKYMKNVKIASIGPITTDTLKKLGYKVSIQPKNYTLKDICISICNKRR